MFKFEKLHVYQKSLDFKIHIYQKMKKSNFDKYIYHQLSRAALSIVLNIAEGTGRSTNADMRHFYIIARGSCYECIAILQVIRRINAITVREYENFYSNITEITKMLHGLIKSTQ